MSIQNNSFSFMGYFVGDVLEVDQTSRRVAAYLPKLMPGIGGENQLSSSIPTSEGGSVEGLNFSQTVRVRNSMWLKPYDFDEPLPAVGSKVLVFFVDANPKMGYWDKFNPDSDYKVAEGEKYPRLISMSVAKSSFQVNSEDSVIIDFPEDYSSVLTETDKTKRVELFKRENYLISDSRPQEPFPGMIWFNSTDQNIYAYSSNDFRKLITRADIEDLYSEVDRISAFLEETLEFWTSGRLVFVGSYSAIAAEVPNPVKNQIAVVDPTVSGEPFYKYTSLESESPLTEDGFYFLNYANLVVSLEQGVTRQLRAYKYDGSYWEPMDGWFAFHQPSGDLGDFEFDEDLATGESYTWDFRSQLSLPELRLKVKSIKFDGFSIPSDTTVSLSFYSSLSFSGDTTIGSRTISNIPDTSDIIEGDSISGAGIPTGSVVVAVESSNSITINFAATATAAAVSLSWRRGVGAVFSVVNTAGTYSISPSYYTASYVDGSDIFLPDISRFGTVISNLSCDVTSDDSATINFGSSIIVEARSSEEV
jgi:hypothetical protein